MNKSPRATSQSEPEKRSRPQMVAESMKDWIVEQALKPGDRLPNEAELIERFNMAKSTIREAVRLLEAQGLIKTRTGPGGGAFVNAPSELRTHALLSNHFYFKNISIRDIYDLRIKLEPEVAASLAGKLNRTQIRALEDIMDTYPQPASNAHEERDQHISSLSFHALMASYSENELLSFIIRFLTNILSELTIYKGLFDHENRELWENGRNFQIELLDAFRKGNSQLAYQVSQAHMHYAREIMTDREIKLGHGFLTEKQGMLD